MLGASLYIRAHLVALLLTERLVKLCIQLDAFTFQDSTKQHFGIKARIFHAFRLKVLLSPV